MKQNSEESLDSRVALAGVIGGTMGLLVSGMDGLIAFSVSKGDIMLHWMGWSICLPRLISGFGLGFILGVFFSFAYDHLPGKRGIVKGTVLAAVLSLPYLVLRFLFIHSLSVPTLILVEAIAKTVILILVWGMPVGYLWNKLVLC
ncbi:hypothetical protein AKJ37_06925 [candidate division MSBL1 archaeon SCGC-AAA259I09]|uniref:Uncharacterized protein n=1 Tax=candidate division MSBL1 archaeon SCGC-AAA259I09 TaxID=1698267 RepID=A0A133UMF6_9EURY|nr:hypothetical protein AKJ37_06925 [candidate division MSBL1 archaeon SCGC-AAA259I09]